VPRRAPPAPPPTHGRFDLELFVSEP
jgi:hypothetical protein